MKVYIGNYCDNRIISNVHKRYMDKRYNYDWEINVNRFQVFLEKFEKTLQWIYDHSINLFIKGRKRNVSVRIDPYDTWSMDHTLALIILPMLKQLRDTKHGSPYVDAEDLPKEMRLTKRERLIFDNGHWDKKLKATDAEKDAASEKFHAQWKWVLDQMIWSFEQELDEEGDYKNYYDPYEPGEVVEDGDGFLNKEWRIKMGKFNRDKYTAYQERKQLGFTLFGKYYQALWD